MIFKAVRDGRPYPDHGLSATDWANIPPRRVRLDELVTTKTVLELDRLLAEESTFFGDLFPHAVRWRDELYLEDGLHRTLRAALQGRTVIHARVLRHDGTPTGRHAAPSTSGQQRADHEVGEQPAAPGQHRPAAP